jgi:hypothetical protein
MKTFKATAVMLCAALGFASVPLVSNAQIYNGEKARAGGPVHAMFVAFAN